VNNLEIEFKNPITDERLISPAMLNLPTDAYERGCVKEGIVTAVDYAANTISVLIDSTTYFDVPFLYHTDVDYGSYVKAMRDLSPEDWPAFPNDALQVFANSTRCFVIPEDGSYYINSGTGFQHVTSSAPTKVLVFSYPEIPFDPENPTEEIVLNKHIAFNIISDFDSSKLDGGLVNAINRPTYWPLLYITRMIDSVTKLFVYDFHAEGVKRILNEDGDTWIDISDVDVSSVDYWYNTCIILDSTDELIELDEEGHRYIYSLYASVVNGNNQGGLCIDESNAWEHDSTNEYGAPITAHTLCVDCSTGYYDNTTGYVDEVVLDCFAANGDLDDLLFNVMGRSVLNVINDPSVYIASTSDGHTYRTDSGNLYVTVSFGIDAIQYEFTASTGRTDWDDDTSWWRTVCTIEGTVFLELDTETSGFEIFRICGIGAGWTEEYTSGTEEDETTYHLKYNCCVDRPATQSYANTFTTDAELTNFINDVVLSDEAVADESLTSITLNISLIYAPYDLRERAVI